MKIHLRKYRPEDAGVICSWIKTEEELYLWSADRLGVFPVPEELLNKIYENVPAETEFVPVTAVDENDIPVGHYFIRILPGKPVRTARFGFVIVNPEYRNSGAGSEMLKQGAVYAAQMLQAEMGSLGVFSQNLPARKCYEKAGFAYLPETERYPTPFGDWACLEMELPLKSCSCFVKYCPQNKNN